MQASTTFPRDAPKEEDDYWYGVLERSNHTKAIHAAEIVEVMAAAPNPDNMYAKKYGIDFSPIFEGHVYFENLGVIHKNHAQQELHLRNYSYEPEDGIHMLASKIKDSEQPGWQELEDDINEEQNHRLKFFWPRYLAAQ